MNAMLRISMILLCLLIPVDMARAKTVESIGVGVFPPVESSGDDQKQAAFVAAFITGVVGLAELIYGMDIKSSMTVQGDKVVSNTIITETNQSIGDFQISNNRLIKGFLVNMDLSKAGYQGQTIVVNDGLLMTPPVQMLAFPNWRTNPRRISAIDIKSLRWHNKECEITLAYTYDPGKITRKGENKNLKRVSFKLLKGVDGGHIYKKTSIEGVAYGGGNDVPDVIRQKSLEQALRNAVEKINGVFIKNITEVRDAVVAKDEIFAETMGQAQVIDKQFQSQFTSEGNYQITCTATVNVPLMELVAE